MNQDNWKRIIQDELIGLEVRIIKARNQTLLGKRGKIIDETKNMIVIESENGRVDKVLKDEVVLEIYKDYKAIEIDGKLLIGRPEDRIRKLKR